MLDNDESIKHLIKILEDYIKRIDLLCKIISEETSGKVVFPNIGKIYYNKLMELMKLYRKKSAVEDSFWVKTVVVNYFNELLMKGFSLLTGYVKVISNNKKLDTEIDIWELNEQLKDYRYRYDVIKNKIAKFDFNTDIDIALKGNITQIASDGLNIILKSFDELKDNFNKELEGLGLSSRIPSYEVLMMPKYDINAIAIQLLNEVKLLFHDLPTISSAIELTVADYLYEGQVALDKKDFKTYDYYVEKLLYFNQEYELCNSIGVYICFVGKVLSDYFNDIANEITKELGYLNLIEYFGIINEGLRNEKYELQAEKRCTYVATEIEVETQSEVTQVQKNVYLN